MEIRKFEKKPKKEKKHKCEDISRDKQKEQQIRYEHGYDKEI